LVIKRKEEKTDIEVKAVQDHPQCEG